MNGKVARALRRKDHGHPTEQDLDILARRWNKEYDLMCRTPHPLPVRRRTPKETQPNWSSSWKRHGAPVVLHPLRAIAYKLSDKRNGYGGLSTLLDGVRSFRAANALPKHLLDLAAA